MNKLAFLCLLFLAAPADAQNLRTIQQAPARPQPQRKSLFNFNRNCQPAPAQPIVVNPPAAVQTDPNLLAAILSRPQATAPQTQCPDYSGQLQQILANQGLIIGLLQTGRGVPPVQPAPLPPAGATVPPTINYYLGTAPFDPGKPGVAPFDPGRPGTAPFNPGTPGTAPFNPGTPGTAPINPGTPGTSPFNPGVIHAPAPPIIIQPQPPVIVPPAAKPPALMPPAPDQPGSAPFGPGTVVYEARRKVTQVQPNWRPATVRR